MQENDLLEYKGKIIKAFKDGTFLSEHLKIPDAAAYNYVLSSDFFKYSDKKSATFKYLNNFTSIF